MMEIIICGAPGVDHGGGARVRPGSRPPQPPRPHLREITTRFARQLGREAFALACLLTCPPPRRPRSEREEVVRRARHQRQRLPGVADVEEREEAANGDRAEL